MGLIHYMRVVDPERKEQTQRGQAIFSAPLQCYFLSEGLSLENTHQAPPIMWQWRIICLNSPQSHWLNQFSRKSMSRQHFLYTPRCRQSTNTKPIIRDGRNMVKQTGKSYVSCNLTNPWKRSLTLFFTSIITGKTMKRMKELQVSSMYRDKHIFQQNEDSFVIV